MSARSRRFPWFRLGFDQYKHETCEHEPIIPNSFHCKKCGEDFSGVTVYTGINDGTWLGLDREDPIELARDVTPTRFSKEQKEALEDLLHYMDSDSFELDVMMPLRQSAYMYGLYDVFTGREVYESKKPKVQVIKEEPKALDAGEFYDKRNQGGDTGD